MSTRSVIAIQTGDTWKGRHCHGDGYPSHQLRVLLALAARDGLEQARTTLTETYAGWSHISADHPDISGVETSGDAEYAYSTCGYGTPEYWAWQFQHGSYGDGRYVSVPGYGVAFSTKVIDFFGGRKNYQQVTEDEWITSDDAKDSDTEWAYVLGKRDIVVFANEGENWGFRGRVGYDVELTDEIARTFECGEDLEHCHHMAWVHFPEAKEANVNTHVWLGRQQPGSHDIHALIVNATGKQIELSGGGSQGSAQDPRDWHNGWDNRSRVRYWWCSAKGGGDLRVFRLLKAGYRLEPTYSGLVHTSAGDIVVPGGTVLSH